MNDEDVVCHSAAILNQVRCPPHHGNRDTYGMNKKLKNIPN